MVRDMLTAASKLRPDGKFRPKAVRPQPSMYSIAHGWEVCPHCRQAVTDEPLNGQERTLLRMLFFSIVGISLQLIPSRTTKRKLQGDYRQQIGTKTVWPAVSVGPCGLHQNALSRKILRPMLDIGSDVK